MEEQWPLIHMIADLNKEKQTQHLYQYKQQLYFIFHFSANMDANFFLDNLERRRKTCYMVSVL